MSFPTKKSVASKTSGATIHITNATRTRWDTRSFCDIATAILPADYELSVVLVGDVRARRLNEQYRDKHTPANVLSFPLSNRAGEVFINLARVRREAADYALTPHDHSLFLLIHGCLHLMGLDHGSRMERAEKKYLKKFSIRYQ